MSFLSQFKPASIISRSAAKREGDAVQEATVTMRPRYRIERSNDAYVARVELPGVSKETLEVVAQDGMIEITGRVAWKVPSGWRPLQGTETEARVYRLRLGYGEGVDDQSITAELADGDLRVRLPKTPEKQPRSIAVS